MAGGFIAGGQLVQSLDGSMTAIEFGAMTPRIEDSTSSAIWLKKISVDKIMEVVPIQGN